MYNTYHSGNKNAQQCKFMITSTKIVKKNYNCWIQAISNFSWDMFNFADRMCPEGKSCSRKIVKKL